VYVEMSGKFEDRMLQTIILESPSGIAGLLRSAAHPMRVQILALLLKETSNFSQLKKETRLSKTALANHLKLLMNRRLVQRVDRGEYSLTADGRSLLNAAATMYRDSVQREEWRTQLMLKRYTKGLTEANSLSKKEITKKVEYLPCWLSYTGAMAGALRALGIDCDIADVGGYSGYSFIINVAKGVTCLSGPTALPPETWNEIKKGTESLGYTVEQFVYPAGYPAEEGKPTPEEIEIAKKMFEKIKQEIDTKDRPVVVWGLAIPEYGIVKGYEGNTYLTSTYRSLAKQPETPILYYDLKAPGCLEAIFFKNPTKPNPKTTDKEALKRAINFTAQPHTLNNYVGGPAALEEWANVLEKQPEEQQNYLGNSYVAACTWESRCMNTEFLKRLANRHKGKQTQHLQKAAETYQKSAALMKEFTTIFPFKPQGQMKLQDRKNAANILRKIKPLEEQAIQHMQKALDNWETD
jgi:DNA-binding HxlR family transcriptional regulator